jgi:hypothetical protein
VIWAYQIRFWHVYVYEAGPTCGQHIEEQVDKRGGVLRRSEWCEVQSEKGYNKYRKQLCDRVNETHRGRKDRYSLLGRPCRLDLAGHVEHECYVASCFTCANIWRCRNVSIRKLLLSSPWLRNDGRGGWWMKYSLRLLIAGASEPTRAALRISNITWL